MFDSKVYTIFLTLILLANFINLIKTLLFLKRNKEPLFKTVTIGINLQLYIASILIALGIIALVVNSLFDDPNQSIILGNSIYILIMSIIEFLQYFLRRNKTGIYKTGIMNSDSFIKWDKLASYKYEPETSNILIFNLRRKTRYKFKHVLLRGDNNQIKLFMLNKLLKEHDSSENQDKKNHS